MKRKIGLFMLCSLALLGVCGCGNGKEDITQKNDSKDTNLNEELTYIGTLTSLEEKNVILANEDFLVTDNSIYVVSFDKLFSNDSNYKKLGTNNNIVGIDMDDWGYFHVLNDKQRILTCSMKNNCSELSNGAKLANQVSLLNGNSVIDNYLYITNDKLYFAKGVYLDSEGHKPKDAILINTTDSIGNEKIVAIYLSNSKYFIKTDKAFYRFKENKITTNKEECEKYADVTCTYEYEYKITKENKLTEHYNDIKYIANDKMIFNDNKVYSLN